MDWLLVFGGFLVLMVASAMLGLLVFGFFLLLSKAMERPLRELEGALGEIHAELDEAQVPRWKVASYVGGALTLMVVSIVVSTVADSAAFGIGVAAAPIVAFKLGQAAVRALRSDANAVA